MIRLRVAAGGVSKGKIEAITWPKHTQERSIVRGEMRKLKRELARRRQDVEE